jgi:hypothetical protein
MTKKNPTAMRIIPASFIPTKWAPYKTTSKAGDENACHYQVARVITQQEVFLSSFFLVIDNL